MKQRIIKKEVVYSPDNNEKERRRVIDSIHKNKPTAEQLRQIRVIIGTE